MKLTWLHLSNPRTGERKKYLLRSPMVFFFGGLFFPFITRRLWGWLAVYVLWLLVNLFVLVLTVDAPGRSGDRLFTFVGLALAISAALVSNKQATRKLLDSGWVVSPDTTPEAWALFQSKWKLPESAKPTWPSAPGG